MAVDEHSDQARLKPHAAYPLLQPDAATRCSNPMQQAHSVIAHNARTRPAVPYTRHGILTGS